MQISNVSTIDIYFNLLILCQWLASQEGFNIKWNYIYIYNNNGLKSSQYYFFLNLFILNLNFFRKIYNIVTKYSIFYFIFHFGEISHKEKCWLGHVNVLKCLILYFTSILPFEQRGDGHMPKNNQDTIIPKGFEQTMIKVGLI